ncbi:MAG: Hint domain-containing protein, partial [Crocosphaera sp.]
MKYTKQVLFILLIISVSVIFGLANLGLPKLASARGGCFSGQTQILTPLGTQAIETLQVGDQVITQNLQTSQLETGKIGKIQVISSPDYYVINHQISVTGTHPFYVMKNQGWKLRKVQDLKVGDSLIHKDNSEIKITDISYINQPIT